MEDLRGALERVIEQLATRIGIDHVRPDPSDGDEERRRMSSRLSLGLFFLWLWLPTTVEAQEWEPSGQLEIHYINVGQGSSVLIIGPDGTRIPV